MTNIKDLQQNKKTSQQKQEETNKLYETKEKLEKKIYDEYIKQKTNIIKECPIKNSNLVNYDLNTNKCTLKECPNGFKKSSDGTQCEMSLDDIDVYRYKKIHRCDNQYIDWITLPNFHLGNSFLRLNTGDSKDDFNGCFEPCNLDFIPYKDTNDKDINKSKDSIHCIRKSIANIGKFGQITLDYCPLTLIILLSCNIVDNNEFVNEYIQSKTNKNIEKQIIEKIKNDQTLLKEMKNEIIAKGKKYIKYLLDKYKPNFLDKLKISTYELSKCYDTALSNINIKNKQFIIYAYNVSKTIDNNVDNYVNAYNYMSNDGDIHKLTELHKKILIWACKYSFDENTNYGKQNLDLYKKLNNGDEINENVNDEIEYIRKVNKNEIRNENDIFFFFRDFFNPGLLLRKLISKQKQEDLLENPYILSLPSTIFLMILLAILIIICVLFYKYTKPLYEKVRELTIILIYNIASIFDRSIKPKYIITDLLDYVREKVNNPRKIASFT